MARKNRRSGAPQVRRGNVPPPPPLSALVIPSGRCGGGSGRKGKLMFTASQAPKALEQARAARMRKGQTAHMEVRYYLCQRCDHYHLTSRTEHEERTA